MAVTQAQLEALEDAYYRGVLSVGHGDKRVVYRSRKAMLETIGHIKRELAGSGRPKTAGFASTKRGI